MPIQFTHALILMVAEELCLPVFPVATPVHRRLSGNSNSIFRQGMHLECSVESNQSQLLEVGLEVFSWQVFEQVFVSQCVSEESRDHWTVENIGARSIDDDTRTKVKYKPYRPINKAKSRQQSNLIELEQFERSHFSHINPTSSSSKRHSLKIQSLGSTSNSIFKFQWVPNSAVEKTLNFFFSEFSEIFEKSMSLTS